MRFGSPAAVPTCGSLQAWPRSRPRRWPSAGSPARAASGWAPGSRRSLLTGGRSCDRARFPPSCCSPAAWAAAPRLSSGRGRPWQFALGALGLGLALRLALGTARGAAVTAYTRSSSSGNHEAASEYLPVLPAFEFGTRFFLDTFAEIGASLPVHAIGHPPGLLVTMHWLGVHDAPGMAALTIGVGALSIPLAYLLARALLDERRARIATLLYVFAPSAVLYGATSADALYTTLALLAAVPLARTARRQGRCATSTCTARARRLPTRTPAWRRSSPPVS